MKLHILLLAGLCVFCGQAFAGLFSDDEARLQIQQIGDRVSKLEEAGKKQTETNTQQAATNSQQASANKKQTATQLDLQSQIENLNEELRNMRGQNEELTHKLQDSEKRQKDYYIDLDTRLRHFETAEAQQSNNAPIVEGDRAYEAAQSIFKSGKNQDAIAAFQEFIKQFPDSVYIPNAHYEIGEAYLALKDYPNALANYQVLSTQYAFSPKTPDAMLSMIKCQIALKNNLAAKKTFKLLAAKYPESIAASEAKKILAKLK
jgi:tol-pal system protein YbgF